MRKLVETVVKRLSDHPDEVRVHEFFEGPTTIYEIAVPAGDRGRLIGREGRTVRALRGFVNAAAAARGKRAVVRVKD